MSRGRMALVLGLGCTLAGLSRGAQGAEKVRLIGWDGTATLGSQRGHGQDYFDLLAHVVWQRSVTGRFAVRVTARGGSPDIQPLPADRVGGHEIIALVKPSSVRNLSPAAVAVSVCVIDADTNAEVSNTLLATIEDFPHPQPGGPAIDRGPFGWGSPLSGAPNAARRLPRPGPDGFRYVRVPSSTGGAGFFVSTTEASNAQVALRLPDYDARAGRSDEFSLEEPTQPALGLSPRRAQAYLEALGRADRAGIVYRLPTRDEWLRAARAGSSSPSWWGEAPGHPSGANFLGPEPGLEGEATAPTVTTDRSGFQANPWGLAHTFGNVAEWAVGPGGGFLRMGGHFRTEPASPLPEVAVTEADATGPDPYVGVRPAFTLEAKAGTELLRRALRADARPGTIDVAFDPDRATATLTGTASDPASRRAAGRRLAAFWFLAAVEDRIASPTVAPGHLAQLGGIVGPVRRSTSLGRKISRIPVEVRWANPLPVDGSEWWVNVYLPGGGHEAHRLLESQPDRSGRVTVAVDLARIAPSGLSPDTRISVALSLGAEAPSLSDPRIVSNVALLNPSQARSAGE